jgi:hypothetical protein
MKPISRTYLSLAAFYAADPRRRDSRERDVGLWWRSVRGPTYRAAWVQDTGELYLFQHALTGPGSGSVHLIRGTFTSAEVDRRLAGWEDQCGRAGSLEWLLAAVSRFADGAPDRAARPEARASRRSSGSAPGRWLPAGSMAGPRARIAGTPA